MAEAGPKKRLAVDTNLLLDLAEGEDWSHEFRERFQAAGYALLAGPTVFQELAFASSHADEPKRGLARKVIAEARSWGIGAFEMNSVQRGIADQFAQRVLGRGLLPPEEDNDAAILAETSLAEIPLLVTSDQHLLEIEEDALLLLFNEADSDFLIPRTGASGKTIASQPRQPGR